MRKFVRTYSPFLVYFVCVALAYFLCFYLFPKYNAALAYLGFLIIYTYIDMYPLYWTTSKEGIFMCNILCAIFLCTISKCLICQNPCKDQPQW